jgi:3-phosphoshikimate 1-carboxyvinyltransferase
MKIYPGLSLRGEIDLPGDKSISHRAAMLLAIAEGEARIHNFSASADCASTLSCLRLLGVKMESENSAVAVRGAGKHGLQKPPGDLDCGNSGTTMRLLSGILAGQNFESVLTGDESLQKRPMQRIIEPLKMMGARVEANDGRAPLGISGRRPLDAISYKPPVASAQLKSCVLLAGLFADGKTSIVEQTPTRDHTERMFRFLGIDVESVTSAEGEVLSVRGGTELIARDINVPGDISAAAFFIVAAACLEGSEAVLKNVGLNPSRTAVLDALRNFGAEIEILNKREVCNEPVGDLVVRKTAAAPAASSNILSGPAIANLIDEIPVLAIFGSQIEGGLEIRDARELRVKESDRILAVVENLRRMGAFVEEFPDGFKVERSYLKGATIDSFGDHRIAMAFAIAGLFADGETIVEGAECAAVSFPRFFEVLDRAVIRQDG